MRTEREMIFMLGIRIAALRSSFGWSQAELARRLNISPSTVGMYEQGRREPSVDMLLTISRVLGVSMEFLLTGHNLCREDHRIQEQISNKREGDRTLLESLKILSRDELLVLVTAELFGSENG